MVLHSLQEEEMQRSIQEKTTRRKQNSVIGISRNLKNNPFGESLLDQSTPMDIDSNDV